MLIKYWKDFFRSPRPDIRYQVKYEKLPTSHNNCGLLGHWYEECGTREHDTSKFEWVGGGLYWLMNGETRELVVAHEEVMEDDMVVRDLGGVGRGEGMDQERFRNDRGGPTYDPQWSWRFNVAFDPVNAS